MNSIHPCPPGVPSRSTSGSETERPESARWRITGPARSCITSGLALNVQQGAETAFLLCMNVESRIVEDAPADLLNSWTDSAIRTEIHEDFGLNPRSPRNREVGISPETSTVPEAGPPATAAAARPGTQTQPECQSKTTENPVHYLDITGEPRELDPWSKPPTQEQISRYFNVGSRVNS